MRHFFFYGTLIAGSGNAVEADAHRKLRPVGPGTVRGRLYAIPDPAGWYPALLPGREPVRGMLYEVRRGFGIADLRALDEYEEFDRRSPEGSLYWRRPVAVSGEAFGCCRAEAYVCKRNLPAASRRIRGGDFRAWLETTGLRAFVGG